MVLAFACSGTDERKRLRIVKYFLFFSYIVCTSEDNKENLGGDTEASSSVEDIKTRTKYHIYLYKLYVLYICVYLQSST